MLKPNRLAVAAAAAALASAAFVVAPSAAFAAAGNGSAGTPSSPVAAGDPSPTAASAHGSAGSAGTPPTVRPSTPPPTLPGRNITPTSKAPEPSKPSTPGKKKKPAAHETHKPGSAGNAARGDGKAESGGKQQAQPSTGTRQRAHSVSVKRAGGSATPRLAKTGSVAGLSGGLAMLAAGVGTTIAAKRRRNM